MSSKTGTARTADQLRTQMRGYLIGAVVAVLATLAAWALTGNAAASTGSLPMAVVLLALAAQTRKQIQGTRPVA